MGISFEHHEPARLRLTTGGDPGAPGAAITVELCGHWEHDGECRWPHHTGVVEHDDHLDLVCSFNASADDVAEVRSRIRTALASESMIGPDGHRTSWSVL